MVQLETKALTTKATENRVLIRRHQSRSTNFTEGSAFTLSCVAEEKILPVFCYPQGLDFYFNDANSLEQNVTVYNPYQWHIKFRVLVTTTGRWCVNKGEGEIAPSCRFDFKVRLLDRSPSLIGKKDQLRIEMQTVTECIKLGKRDLTCNFFKEWQGEGSQKQYTNLDSSDDDSFAFENKFIETPPPTDKKPQEIAAATAKSATSKSDTQGANRNKSKNDPKSSWPPSSYVFTAIMCGIILCLPTEECILPAYLVISHTPKYIAAYVLGIITSLLCKYY